MLASFCAILEPSWCHFGRSWHRFESSWHPRQPQLSCKNASKTSYFFDIFVFWCHQARTYTHHVLKVVKGSDVFRFLMPFWCLLYCFFTHFGHLWTKIMSCRSKRENCEMCTPLGRELQFRGSRVCHRRANSLKNRCPKQDEFYVAFFTQFWATLASFCAILEPSWRHFGRSWHRFEPSWHAFAPTWHHFAPLWWHFGASYRHFGPSWRHFGHLGLILGHRCAILGNIDTILGNLDVIVGHLGHSIYCIAFIA